MAIDYKSLLNRKFFPIEHNYSVRDTILYALGIGLGHDPLDESALRFVHEDGLCALPTMPTILAYPGFWQREPDTGIDWVRYMNVGQGLVIHKPLPTAGTVQATTRITDIVDKGVGRGALIFFERMVRDQTTGDDLCTVKCVGLARNNGGFCGERQSAPERDFIPAHKPDHVCDLSTLPQQALIYRLSGDYNPLHASPATARKAGFRAPILHGLCTLGVASHAILRKCCNYDPAGIHEIRARFSAPVYPGETLRTEIWQSGNEVAFRSRVVERDVIAIDNGHAKVQI